MMKGIKLGGWFFAIVVTGWLVACQPAQGPSQSSAPVEEPQETDDVDSRPAGAPAGRGTGAGGGGGHGAGGGGGQGTGGGQAGDCGAEVVMSLDGETIWSRTREELAAHPAVAPIAGYRDGTILGARLDELFAEQESVRRVRISSCGGRAMEVKARQIEGAPVYLQLGRSGRWRLVDLANPESLMIFIRDVTRIELSTAEEPVGGDDSR